MLSSGYVLNQRYRIVKLLGQGGFGAVYRAWDLNLNVAVAVKENTETSSEAARQFAREANILANLRHPNLPKVTDHFILPTIGQYLVMEYIEGDDLNQKLEMNSGPLPEKQVLDWIKQILSALTYLHSQNPPIIHRDIKPENIRVTPTGQALLVDFGIAKLSDGSKKTTVGARAVTPGYSPHEQYGMGTTDARADIYALGATTYTLLTAQTPPESISRLIEDPLTPIRSFNPTVSPATEQAVLKAMDVNPERRWQSAEEFLNALCVPVAKTYVMPASGPVIVAKREYQPAQKKTGSSSVLIVGLVSLVFILVSVIGIFVGLKYLLNKSGQTASLPLVSSPAISQVGVNTPMVTNTSLPPTNSPAVTQEIAAVPNPSSATIKIGLIAPLTGQVPTFGLSTREGVELAVKEWNAIGGLLGREIELIVADGQCAADPAVNAANKLIDQDEVKYLIGEVCSSASIPVSEIANRKKVVQISPTSTNLAVTVDSDGHVKPYTFRACFTDPFQGLVMAKFAQSEGYQRAFVMYDPANDYVRGLAEAFEKSFTEMGGQIVGMETYTSQDTNFSAILKKAADSKAQVLFLPDYYNIINIVGEQAKNRGLNAVMMGGDGWDSSDLSVEAADGGFYANHYDPGDTRPIVAEWLGKYGDVYKDDKGQSKIPDALATLGYDAANLLFAAIDTAGVDDTAKVAEALEGITWQGVTGAISFDSQHNPIKNAAIITIRNGQKFYFTSILP